MIVDRLRRGTYAEIDSDRGQTAPLTPLEQAQRIADLAQDKLARDVTILDMRPVCSYTDFFVICTGNTDRQAKAIHDGIHEGMKKDHGILPRRAEGVSEARWILLDYLDIVVHVFTPETREFYGLERLWGEVPQKALAV